MNVTDLDWFVKKVVCRKWLLWVLGYSRESDFITIVGWFVFNGVGDDAETRGTRIIDGGFW